MAGRPRTKIKKIAELYLAAFELKRQLDRERPAHYERAACSTGEEWQALLEKDELAKEWNEAEFLAGEICIAIQSLVIETGKRAKIEIPYLDRLPYPDDERPLDVIRKEVFAKRDQSTAPHEPQDEAAEEADEDETVEAAESEPAGPTDSVA